MYIPLRSIAGFDRIIPNKTIKTSHYITLPPLTALDKFVGAVVGEIKFPLVGVFRGAGVPVIAVVGFFT